MTVAVNPLYTPPSPVETCYWILVHFIFQLVRPSKGAEATSNMARKLVTILSEGTNNWQKRRKELWQQRSMFEVVVNFMVQEDNELCFNPLKFQERPTSIFLNTILFNTSSGEIREIWELMKWTSRGNALIIYQIITTKFFMEIKQISWEIFMWILGVEGLNNMDTSLKMDT